MGTSLLLLCKLVLYQDHPHAYGDKAILFMSADKNSGSSPRVWGQVDGDKEEKNAEGIIPTRMGTSSVFSIARISVRDHPHAYGDKSFDGII